MSGKWRTSASAVGAQESDVAPPTLGKAVVVDRGSASFGDAVRAQRIRAGLTQQELARRAGGSVRAGRYIEQGRVARPRRESVRRLAGAGRRSPHGPLA